MTIIEAKVIQKGELTKERINSTIEKGIWNFFDTVDVTKDCDFNFKIEKIEDNKVHVKFSWIRDYDNYDREVNTWDEVYDNFYSVYNFSKSGETLIEEIVEELENNVIVNY